MSNELDKQFELAIRKDDASDFDASRFEPARWPGGPIICLKENLPAFTSKEAALDYHRGPNKTNPQYEVRLIKKIGKCGFCGWWHMVIKPRDPAGSSSGVGRSSK